jgi:Flp pilus assembly protein TadG
LPLFLAILAVAVQYALMVNAKILVTDAAAAAARSAMTSLPEESPDNIKKAACFMLVPICPKAAGGASAEAQQIADALATLQTTVPSAFAERYTYAQAAAEVIYPNGDYKHTHGEDILVTVRYRFYMTVPLAMRLMGGQSDTVAGIEGRFWTVESTVRVQTSHGRAADSDGNGWAQ